MKRSALLLLSGSLIAGISGCSGTNTAAPYPSPPAPVTVSPGSSAPGPAPPATATAAAPAPAPAPSAAVAVVTDYYRAIFARNYGRAFTYLAPDATGPDDKRLTAATFLQLAQMMDGQAGPVTGFSVGAFQPLIVMTVSRARAGQYHAHLRMVRSEHGWAISSIDRI